MYSDSYSFIAHLSKILSSHSKAEISLHLLILKNVHSIAGGNEQHAKQVIRDK